MSAGPTRWRVSAVRAPDIDLTAESFSGDSGLFQALGPISRPVSWDEVGRIEFLAFDNVFFSQVRRSRILAEKSTRVAGPR